MNDWKQDFLGRSLHGAPAEGDGAENFPITLFTSKHWEVCADKAAFEKGVQPVFDAYIKQQGKNLLDQIRAAKKK